MHNHLVSYFPCPKSTIYEIKKLSRHFFWGTSYKVSPPVSWNNVCTNKKLSGLGVRNMERYNIAALAKLGWKLLIEPNNWWVKLVSAKY